MAAGKGIRMRPLTENLPKPLLKIGNTPILDYLIQELPDKVEEIILVVGFLKDQIKKYLSENYKDRKITFVDEDKMLGTGFAAYACKNLVKDRFLALNGDDLYKKSDLEKLMNVDLGFLVKNIAGHPEYELTNRRVGKVIFDAKGKMIDIVEEIPGQEDTYLNIGAYMLNQKFFDYELVQIQNGEFGLPQTLAIMARNGEEVKILEADFWFPVGYPEDLQKAEAYIIARSSN